MMATHVSGQVARWVGRHCSVTSSSSSTSCFRTFTPLRDLSTSGVDSEELEEFFDKHLAKPGTPGTPRQSIATTRKESLSLYRDVLRFSKFFTWPDSNGVPFRVLIRESARKEYEAARFEKDPHIINKLIVSGRDCLDKAMQNFIARQREIVEDERSRAQNPNSLNSNSNNNKSDPFPYNY